MNTVVRRLDAYLKSIAPLSTAASAPAESTPATTSTYDSTYVPVSAREPQPAIAEPGPATKTEHKRIVRHRAVESMPNIFLILCAICARSGNTGVSGRQGVIWSPNHQVRSGKL
jgi:hypothetical protein